MIDLNLFQLPTGVTWYEVGGQRVFPLYGASGGICAMWMAWLITADDSKRLASPIRVNLSDGREEVEKKILDALLCFVEFDPNGGALPMQGRAISA